MVRVWSEKAVEEQRNVNRFVRSLREDPAAFERIGLFPTLVRAQEDIPPGGSGYCVFQRGLLDGDRDDSNAVALMHNLVSDAIILQGETALAQRVTVEESGESGWVILRVRDNQNSPFHAHECIACDGKRMERISLQISGLTDLTAAPDDNTYDGWAAVVNGTYELNHTEPFLPCQPGIEFSLPDNSDPERGGDPSIAGKFRLQLSGLGILPFFRDLEINPPLAYIHFWQGDEFSIHAILRTVYVEQTSGAGLMSRVTGVDGIERIDCRQTYSNYGLLIDESGTNFSTWLGNGTFTLNP